MLTEAGNTAMGRAPAPRGALCALVVLWSWCACGAVKSSEPKGDDADWYLDPGATHGYYGALEVAWNATGGEIAAAYASRVQALEKAFRRNGDAWFASQGERAKIYELVFTALDGDGDGALNATEARDVLASLGLGEQLAGPERDAVDAWRRKTLPRAAARKGAYFSSKAHLLAVSSFATYHEAFATLDDAALRAAYDAREKERAAAYAADVARGSSWRAALGRFASSLVVFVAGLAACAYAALVVLVGAAYLAGRAVARLPLGALSRSATRAADAAGAALVRWRPRWEYVLAAVVLAPETCVGVLLLGYVGAHAAQDAAARGLANLGASLDALPAASAAGVKVGLAAVVAAAVLRPAVAAASRPRDALRALLASAKGAAAAAGAAAARALKAGAWTVLPYVFFHQLSSFLEEHLFALLAAAAALLFAVKPLRAACLAALGHALADAGLAPSPDDAPEVDRVLRRVARIPVVDYADPLNLDDAALMRALDDAGFTRRPDAPPPSRDTLLEAFGDAFGQCSICLAPFEDGDRCRRIDPCAHVFHVDCLDQWVAACAKQTKVPTCAYCNAKL